MVLLTFPILLSLAAFGLGWGSALRIEIQPLTTEGSSGPVNVSCQIDHQDSDAEEIFMLIIMKDGEKPLVSLQPSGIQLGPGVNPSKFLTEGLIYRKDISTSYIKLGILDPTSQDEGKYTCFMIFVDKHHQVSERRASANFVKLTLNDVVMMLRGQVATLEGKLEAQTSKVDGLRNENQNQKEMMKDMAATVSDQQGEIDGLRKENQQQNEKMKAMAATVDGLRNENQNQKEMMKDMAATDSFVCAFSAKLGGADTVIDAHKDIVFKKVEANLGGGYNAKDGVFTAPRDGLYVFTLEMTASMNSKHYCCKGQVVLDVNRAWNAIMYVDVVKDSATANTWRHPQSSITRVYSLTKGDTVNARTINYKIQWNGNCFFSGFLL